MVQDSKSPIAPSAMGLSPIMDHSNTHADKVTANVFASSYH